MNKHKRTDIVTPFDWQQFTAATPANAATQRASTRRPKKKLTVREQVQRILGQRWGNPYCKPGLV